MATVICVQTRALTRSRAASYVTISAHHLEMIVPSDSEDPEYGGEFDDAWLFHISLYFHTSFWPGMINLIRQLESKKVLKSFSYIIASRPFPKPALIHILYLLSAPRVQKTAPLFASSHAIIFFC
jgi:hypothetical protein